MSIINLPNGIGETLGDSLVVNKPLEVSGNIWYVSSVSGADAASPKGQNKQAPLATLGQARTNAANGDIIVLLADHSEGFAAVLTIAKSLTIVGAGSSGGKPTVRLLNKQVAGDMLSFTGPAVQLRNIYFPENDVTNSGNRVVTSSSAIFRMEGCFFECGGKDEGAAMSVGDGVVDIRNTTFEVTSLDNTDQPGIALDNAEGALNTLQMDGVVFDGGVAGFSDYFAMDMSVNTLTRIWAENISLLNGADLKIPEAAQGYVNARTSTGAGRIDWCDI